MKSKVVTIPLESIGTVAMQQNSEEKSTPMNNKQRIYFK